MSDVSPLELVAQNLRVPRFQRIVRDAAARIDALTAELAKAAELLRAPVQCPCGALYVKVEGGYVPSCDCSSSNTVTVTPKLISGLTADNPPVP